MKIALILVVFAIAWLATRAIAATVWPERKCRRCDGAGKFMAQWGGSAWRKCPKCGGSGSKTRFGNRVIARMRRRDQ